VRSLPTLYGHNGIGSDVVYAAVKANPDPYVLRLLAALGTGFDCASHNEINMILGMANVDPSRIIFANPCKAMSFIRHAARSSVDKMTFDNTDELYKIARAHPSAKLVVRVLTDDSKSLCRLGLKFGAPLVTVPALLAKARELGLDVIGVSFHVGSGCFDSSAFADAIMRARVAFDMGREAGYEFDFLDVGGGFEDARFEETAAVVNTALDQYFPDRKKLKVIAEPGRFYVSTAFTLATNIIARRARATPDFAHCARDDTSSASEDPSVMCTFLTPYFHMWTLKNRRTLTDHRSPLQITSTTVFMGRSTASCSTIRRPFLTA
jgi:ornithine decarboxylase